MSNVNHKKQAISNPFHREENQSVGNTYGERARFQESQGIAPAAPRVEQHRDQFNCENARNVEFSPNARFQKTRRYFSGSPHKPRALDNTEKGAYSQASQGSARRPSDPAILNFLDKVIQSSPAKKTEQLQRQARRVATSAPTRPNSSSELRARRASS